MKRYKSIILLLIVVFASHLGLAQKQESKSNREFRSWSYNQPECEYPMVNDEGQVRTQIFAPTAHRI